MKKQVGSTNEVLGKYPNMSAIKFKEYIKENSKIYQAKDNVLKRKLDNKRKNQSQLPFQTFKGLSMGDRGSGTNYIL